MPVTAELSLLDVSGWGRPGHNQIGIVVMNAEIHRQKYYRAGLLIDEMAVVLGSQSL